MTAVRRMGEAATRLPRLTVLVKVARSGKAEVDQLEVHCCTRGVGSNTAGRKLMLACKVNTSVGEILA